LNIYDVCEALRKPCRFALSKGLNIVRERVPLAPAKPFPMAFGPIASFDSFMNEDVFHVPASDALKMLEFLEQHKDQLVAAARKDAEAKWLALGELAKAMAGAEPRP
jgi:hypothetical protein